MVAAVVTPPKLESVRIARAEKSLRYFVEYAWPIVEPNTPFVPGWHIDFMCDVAMGIFPHQHLHNVIFNEPPRHMKSLLFSVLWQAWLWGPANMPWLRGLNFTYSHEYATRDGNKMRQLIKSRWYRERWGDRFDLMTSAGEDRKIRFANSQGGFRVSTTCPLGAATGEGGHLIVVDDAQKAQDAHSETSRAALKDWWRGTMSTRLNDPNVYGRLINGQRLHQMDMVGIVLEATEEAAKEGVHIPWTWAVLPARLKQRKPCTISMPHKTIRDPRTDPSEPLWPAKFPNEKLRVLEVELGPWAAAGQLDQSPTPIAGNMFPRGKWARFKRAPDKFRRVLVSVDAAFKKGEGNSFVVMLTALDTGEHLYVVRRRRKRLSYAETRAGIIENNAFAVEQWGEVTKSLIEEKANGPAIISDLRELLANPDDIVPINPGSDSKEARAAAASPYVASGNVLVPEDWSDAEMKEWEDEFADFPNAPHDDQVDALSQLVIWWRANQDVRPPDLRPSKLRNKSSNAWGSITGGRGYKPGGWG